MSLVSFIGIGLAGVVEAFLLGTFLFYLTARRFKAPTTWIRAAGLCAALIAVAFGLLLLLVEIGHVLTPLSFSLVAGSTLFVGGLCLPWYLTKRVLNTGWARALGVWVAAWVPLVVVNLALVNVTRTNLADTYLVPTGPMAPTLIGAHADRICPNCGCKFAVSVGESARRPRASNCPNCLAPQEVDAEATLLAGDCVLADKTKRAGRWSIAVFRDQRKRKERHMSRIVGVPGETIELAGGDVFVNGRRMRKEPEVAPDLWLTVHDTALIPKETSPSTPGWRPRGEQSGWHESQGTWRIENGRNDDLLAFAGKVTDFLPYNDRAPEEDIQERMVGDVLVTCEISEFAGTGGLGFQWDFGHASVRAEAKGDGQILIETKTTSDAEELYRGRAVGRSNAPLAKGDLLSFAIRDGQGYVMHNGIVAALAIVTPDNVESARSVAAPQAGCRMAISAKDCSVALKRITVHRDVYYYVAGEGDSNPSHGQTGVPFTLGHSEYFMLGDNSARSLDSRSYGGVLSSDLLGVVRGIYWPIGRWHEFN